MDTTSAINGAPDAALAGLAEAHRAQEAPRGRHKQIAIDPAMQMLPSAAGARPAWHGELRPVLVPAPPQANAP